MCLTKKASRERKWGRYPALRTVLEDRRLESYLPSIFDTFPDYLSRTLEIAELALQNSGEISEAARFLIAPESMQKDVDTLATDLEHAARSLNDLAKDVRMLRKGCNSEQRRAKFRVVRE